MRGTSVRVAVGILAGALALTACGGERGGGGNGGGGRLSIATGNTTGVYYVLGGGYAKLINDHLPGYKATAESTSASVENIERVVRGDSDIAFSLADTAADAVNGTGSFTSKQPIRALARIYNNYTQVVVRNGANIRSIADMRGKTVSTGSVNSGTEVIAERLLEAAGLDADKDIKRQKLSLDESVELMKSGRVDALFWSGGLPTGGITDLMTSQKGKVTLLDLSDSLGPLQGKYGSVYQPAPIPAATYEQSQDVPTIAVPNVLLVKDTMDDTLAHDLTKLLFDHKADLEKVHPEAKNITLENATKTDPVQLHPGAKKFYDERQ